MTRLFAPIAALLLLTPAIAVGQNYSTIDEVVVTAAPTRDRVTPPSLVLDQEALQEFQPVATADVLRNVIGVSMRTNSRGESVIRIRGAEERQSLVFLDGAPLATPWDGRADLALLPAGLIDRLEVSRGVVPIEYGPNAIAGAVDLLTYQPDAGGDYRAELQQGTLGATNLNGVAGLALDNGWSFVGGISKIDRDAERIADPSSVAFDPSTNRERTNTDMRGNSFFAASGYEGESFFLRASILHADVERGVAAQGDIDPSVSSPRFWRIPQWRLTQATLNGRWDLSDTVGVRFTGWRQWFDQTIDAYEDYSYTALTDRELGQDDTVGARLALSWELDRATLRLVSTAQESTHDNQEFATDSGSADDFIADPVLRYRQRLTTFGAEADVRLSETLTSTVGIANDRSVTPLTGDKPAQDSLSATGWSAGLRWSPSERWNAAATLGQRTRFPTPREMYGAALGRFLLNPDLGPERALLADLNVKIFPSDTLTLDVALWSNDSDDALSQRQVQVDGASRRQRYNTNGSYTYGLEASATWYIRGNLRTELSAALQDGRVKPDENGDRPPLLQRPEQQIIAALDWQSAERIDLRAEVVYTGRAYDIADNGDIVELPDATSLNLRGFFLINSWSDRDVHVTASVDNVTDALVLPQLGLPAPGRMYRLGLRIN